MSQKGDELKRELVVSETPFDFLFSLNLGKLEWTSDCEVVLFAAYGGNKWSVNLDL
jgi:hypothetical protein